LISLIGWKLKSKRKTSQFVHKQGEQNLKILLTGAGFQNKGSAAMVISVQKAIREMLPCAEFVLASNSPKFDAKRAKQYRLKIFNYTFTVKRNLKPVINLLSELRNTDVVVDLSGFVFSDKIKKTGILIRALTILICKIARKPFILYSQSLGPFNRRFTRIACKICLQRAKFICVRGEVSKKYLNDLGMKNNIRIYADSAFLLEPASQKRLDEILQLEKIPKTKRKRIGIAVNGRIYERTLGLGTDNHYVELIAKLSDFLIENMDAEIVFIPYEIKAKGYDDRSIAKMIYKKIKAKTRVHLINNEYDPHELKALKQTLELFIGSRFHSIIASTSMAVPTIAIGWGPKYFEIMQTLGQEEYVVNHNNTSLSHLINLVNRVWDRKLVIKEELHNKMKSIKKSAIENAKLVTEVITD
jgi:colanic acid/amylovoran biosynthesis protein